ncbi:MAG: MarC family protein [Candidatus Brocadiia bacterium]
MGEMARVVQDALYMLALLNPVSKIAVLTAFASEYEKRGLVRAAARSSAIAAGILALSLVFGEFVLRQVFHVEIHSLQVAGGMVLWWVGFGALRKGVFFEREAHERFADISVVPLACPMIAGPASITACIALSADRGTALAGAAVVLALGANLALMLLSRPIGAALSRFNVLGALIRITGLIVLTMGVQMVLEGLRAWAASLP